MPIIIGIAVVLAIAVFGYVFEPNLVGNILASTSRLSATQIAQYAANAGFTGDDLITAIAIALAESGGNPKAHGDQSLGSGTGSFGLWQIYSDAHPEFGPDFTRLYDPQTNASAAFQVYTLAGASFSAWSTFKNGAYEAYLSQANDGVNA